MNDVNLNYAACVKEANYIGHTHYANVCTGAAYDVAWGGADWIANFGAGLFLFGLGALVLGACVDIGWMAYDTWRMGR